MQNPGNKICQTPVAQKPKLLNSVREAIRVRHYSRRTEEAYIHWIRRFIVFHGVRHPAEMGKEEVNQFLTHLAVKENVSASTQNQAFSALLFLYKQVLGTDIGFVEGVVRARRPKRLPIGEDLPANADREWSWQYVFPASSHDTDSTTGLRHRHHVHETVIQKAVRECCSAGTKPASCHTLDIRTVQELLGHNDVKTTMIYYAHRNVM